MMVIFISLTILVPVVCVCVCVCVCRSMLACVLCFLCPECAHNLNRLFYAYSAPLHTVVYRGGVWGFKPPPLPRNSEGPPKSCQTQPDYENC